MALVSRNILKSFFQTGDKPTQAQFDSLIDSLLHYAEDRNKLGLRLYNPANAYLTSETVIFEEDIYIAIADTTGSFNMADWRKICPSLKFEWTLAGPFSATDTPVEVPFDEDFVPLVAGTYTIEWYCELGRNSSTNVTNKTTILLNDEVIGQSAPRIADDQEYIGFGGFYSTILPATIQNLKVDFYRFFGTQGSVLLKNIRIRVIKD